MYVYEKKLPKISDYSLFDGRVLVRQTVSFKQKKYIATLLNGWELFQFFPQFLTKKPTRHIAEGEVTYFMCLCLSRVVFGVKLFMSSLSLMRECHTYICVIAL
jgi:hypothetical protein